MMLQANRLRKRDKTIPKEETSWTPMLWAINLITQAKNKGKIKLDPPILASLLSGFECIEAQNRKLLNYSWVNYPLPYTQVNITVINLTLRCQNKFNFCYYNNFCYKQIFAAITDCYPCRIYTFHIRLVQQAVSDTKRQNTG